jgi:hypothetical protein
MELTLKTKCFFFKFQNFEICDLLLSNYYYSVLRRPETGDRQARHVTSMALEVHKLGTFAKINNIDTALTQSVKK